MNTEAMQVPALVQRLVQSHGAQWVGHRIGYRLCA